MVICWWGDHPRAWKWKMLMSDFILECMLLLIFSSGRRRGGMFGFHPLLMLPAEPFQRSIDLRSSPSFPCWVASFSAYRGVGTDRAKLMQLAMIRISVSALPWCAACFSIACYWLINHSDGSVSRWAGWPPSLNDTWPFTRGWENKY